MQVVQFCDILSTFFFTGTDCIVGYLFLIFLKWNNSWIYFCLNTRNSCEPRHMTHGLQQLLHTCHLNFTLHIKEHFVLRVWKVCVLFEIWIHYLLWICRTLCLASVCNLHSEKVSKPKHMWRYHTNVTSRVTTLNMHNNNMTACWQWYRTGIRAIWQVN